MGRYFEDHLSMFAACGAPSESSGILHALSAISRRYLGQNPPHPLTYRAFNARGILRGKDYRYHANMAQFFPDARPEQYVYAWSKYWSHDGAELKADASCFSPMVVYLNGITVFKSDIFGERHPDARHRILLPMQPGWNHLVLRFQKTRAGFGGIFGTWLGKHPYYFLMPTRERAGQEGWLFTAPLDGELPALPGPGIAEHEDAAGMAWFPQRSWDDAAMQRGVFERLFGHNLHHTAFTAIAWTKAVLHKAPTGKYHLHGSHEGPIQIVIQDKLVHSASVSGKIDISMDIPAGHHDVFVGSQSPLTKNSRWGFELAMEPSDGAPTEPIDFESPCNIQGTSDPWMYLGPLPHAFELSNPVQRAALQNLNQVHSPAANQSNTRAEIYWRLDAPDTFVRPYNENPLFGHWNYPLGVTLYGLLHAARMTGSSEIQQYIADHLRFCIETFPLARWDASQYGGATAFHTLLCSLDSLDDCGSFASAMLEVAKFIPLEGARPIADYVANYISTQQARLPDGTFFRRTLMHSFHENTLWVDDLYMSVPFLCRYAQASGDAKYLDDAARQFHGFKQRLFIPELKLMSHVFDFRRDMATGVPWGRGNGWTIFALSELLGVLPEHHQNRPELMDFFRELCQGILVLQDADGMWHQVLTHGDSYPETSCAAMFACAFARGVQYGWLTDPEPYAQAAAKAWLALTRISIDRQGNIFGVCRGSEFSFSPDYYKNDLLPNVNDTHGIGIVLLAGVEVLRMKARFAEINPSQFK